MLIEIADIHKNDLIKLKNLWEKSRHFRRNDSSYLKDHSGKLTFEMRCMKFNDLEDDDIKIEIINENSNIVGYCISTIDKNIGEIDSMFVEEKYRNKGYGGLLVQHSLDWLKSRKCEKIVASVGAGHSD
jgi:diamine N-acetyltransferase